MSSLISVCLRVFALSLFRESASSGHCLEYYSTPDRGSDYWDERVCLSVLFVCPRAYLWNYCTRLYTSDLHQTLVPYSCISGFTHDVVFAHKRRLTYKRSACAAFGLAIPVTGQRTRVPTSRALKVTPQVAAPGAESACLSLCLVCLSVREHTSISGTTVHVRSSPNFGSVLLYFRFYRWCRLCT